MDFIYYSMSDEYLWVNVTAFVFIVIFAIHGGGLVSMGMGFLYLSYISVDAFYLWHEYQGSWMHGMSKFSSIMYMAVSIICLMTMMLFFVNAMLRTCQAKTSFLLALYIGVYYLVPNLIQAGMIEYTTDLIPLYEYVYDLSVYIDMLFVIAGWLSLRGGDEMARPGRHSY